MKSVTVGAKVFAQGQLTDVRGQMNSPLQGEAQ